MFDPISARDYYALAGIFKSTQTVEHANVSRWLMADLPPITGEKTTDEFGHEAMVDKVHMHDLHATILHLLGLDHEELTYRHAGRNFRLTDVHGSVVDGIIG
jgi:hypothetical protein